MTHSIERDWAAPPGWLVEEYLDHLGMSQAELARRCGRSRKLISEIVSGKAPVEPKTAIQLERVLGVRAQIWLGMEASYRVHVARQAETAELRKNAEWAKQFPLRELRRRGVIELAKATNDTVTRLLSFFGVASVNAWQARYGTLQAAYRHSPSFKSDSCALSCWIRLCEREAENQVCAGFHPVQFKEALRGVRELTTSPLADALERTGRLCNSAGVALALVKPLPKVALSGAAWWPTPRTPMIGLSGRHRTDDHFWFSFFHEAAHLLLHGKKRVFIDGGKSGSEGIEAEANAWAADALIPKRSWTRFIASGDYTKRAVRKFAITQGIAQGIVVGRLQHESHIAWSHLNDLKVRLDWDASGTGGR